MSTTFTGGTWSPHRIAADITYTVSYETFQIVWPALAILAYVLLRCILRVLAVQRKSQIEFHNRLRESIIIRNEYLDSVNPLLPTEED